MRFLEGYSILYILFLYSEHQGQSNQSYSSAFEYHLVIGTKTFVRDFVAGLDYSLKD